MILLVGESHKLRDLQIADSQASQYIAFFPSRESHETLNAIFARSKSHFSQNYHEKNCETRLAVNTTLKSTRLLRTIASEKTKCRLHRMLPLKSEALSFLGEGGLERGERASPFEDSTKYSIEMVTL
jgi:hypothetical protein